MGPPERPAGFHLSHCHQSLNRNDSYPAHQQVRASESIGRTPRSIEWTEWGKIMRNRVKKGGLCAAAATLLCVSMPAQAVMQCWNPTQVAAAKVRDLQSRLMVATLRCQTTGADMSGAYNRFVRANRETIQGANAVLLAQFRTGFGDHQGDSQYDHFATALANGYGAETTDAARCADAAALADEAAGADGDIGRLVAIEDRFGFSSELPGGQCAVSFASAAGN